MGFASCSSPFIYSSGRAVMDLSYNGNLALHLERPNAKTQYHFFSMYDALNLFQFSLFSKSLKACSKLYSFSFLISSSE